MIINGQPAPPGIARKYGWNGPGLPRRRGFRTLELTSFPPLSPSKDLTLTGFVPPIWDQGPTGSCTGHGSTRGLAYARSKAGVPYVDLSRLFPYYNARAAEGDAGQDSGASVGDVIVALQQQGDCPYVDLPTDPSLVTVSPSAQAVADAIQHKALSATRVLGATPQSFEYHFKHCIDVLGLPVVFGFTAYESFEGDAIAATGIMPMPASDEQVLGGHCVCAVAYDDTSRYVTIDNSYGTSWGLSGRFKMPYAFIFDPDMASDFHAIRLGE